MVTPNYYLFQGILLALIKLLVRLVHPLLLLALLVGGKLVPAGLFALGGYLAGDLYGDAHNGDDADDD